LLFIDSTIGGVLTIIKHKETNCFRKKRKEEARKEGIPLIPMLLRELNVNMVLWISKADMNCI
jgi:hypothetical protein